MRIPGKNMPDFMKPNWQFAIVSALALFIASICSHLMVSWVKVRTTAGEAYIVGRSSENPPAFLAGSSLAAYGISWEQITNQLHVEIRTWGIAGGSPYEWEQFQDRVPDARTTFLVVSAYDLDEGIICDFRAELVPLRQTINALRDIHANWAYTKQALSQYPIAWLRTPFPTLGRSRGILGDLRIKIQNIRTPSANGLKESAGPTITFGKGNPDDEYKKQKISDWNASEIVRKTSAMRAGIQEEHSFNGLKMRSLERMLQYADQRGRTIVVVLPVSPIYSKEFLPDELMKEFEGALLDLQRRNSRAEWLRLDQIPELVSDQNFCDLVHMNVFGQKIATAALRDRLGPHSPHP